MSFGPSKSYLAPANAVKKVLDDPYAPTDTRTELEKRWDVEKKMSKKEPFDFTDWDTPVESMAISPSTKFNTVFPSSPSLAAVIGGGQNKEIGKAVGLFDFVSSEAEDLSFKKGEIIQIIKKDEDSEWWTGRIGVRQGIFPSNYTEPVK